MINEKQARKYCAEDISKIENYDKAMADSTQTWVCHHKLEIQDKCSISPKTLKKQGLYYKVPAYQLVFMTRSEHIKIHNTFHIISKRGKKAIGDARREYGATLGFTGKTHSDETKLKMSKSRKGQRWWTNGIVQTRAYCCPEGFWLGRL